MGSYSREEIEMFCLARLINCYIDTDPENNFIDWCVPPTNPHVYLSCVRARAHSPEAQAWHRICSCGRSL